MSEKEAEHPTTNKVCQNDDFTKIQNFGHDFLDTVPNTKVDWPAPFDKLSILPAPTKGRFGRSIVKEFFSGKGLNVSQIGYQMIINDLQVRVKTGFESENGLWFFEQIIPQPTYDYLCCIGMSTDSIMFFIVHKSEIRELIKDGIITEQHGDDFWLITDVNRIPSWYLGDATLDAAIDIFQKCSTNNYTLHRGQLKPVGGN